MQNPRANPKPAGSITVVTAIIAGLIRLVPHPPNCTPVGALGLFAGGRLPWWLALPLPLALMCGTDYLLYKWQGLPPYDLWVYAGFVAYVLIGRLLVGKRSWWRIAAVTMLGSVAFFLITNFGVWYASIGLSQPMYAPTAAGLMACYVAGLEFFRYTLVGDLAFAAVTFGAYEWLTRPAGDSVPAPEEVPA